MGCSVPFPVGNTEVNILNRSGGSDFTLIHSIDLYLFVTKFPLQLRSTEPPEKSIPYPYPRGSSDMTLLPLIPLQALDIH